MLRNFNNKTEKVGDELKNDLTNGSKVRVAAAIFSIYGYQSLKNELANIEELRFIFTDPTFVETEKQNREQRFFQINANNRKRAISGTEFEINLKNELKGRAIARECKQWIESKVKIKTNTSNRYIQPQILIEDDRQKNTYLGIDEFSSAGFGYENDNAILRNVVKYDQTDFTEEFIRNFDEVWDDPAALKDITTEVTAYIANLYKENSPEFIYYVTLYNIFNEFLEDISEDELANERTGFKSSLIWSKMYDFQKDAVLGIINKLERFNGCILADSVGLGKTFTALGVIKYYQERNKSILVLCPKKLGDNWSTFLTNYEDNQLYKDRFNYDVLFHTDLSRKSGFSNGIDLSRVNWSNYDLVVIDESHNFRNNDPHKDHVTRYQRLLNEVMREGVKTKVLMLSATPVNNRFTDLRNQIALAYEGKTAEVDEKIDESRSIDTILTNAQKTFNEWSQLPLEERTSAELLKRLNAHFDFFKLLDSVTIARSRKHIEKYYDMNAIGKFPNRLKPITHRPDITDLPDFIDMKELYERLVRFNMSVYSPFDYLLPEKVTQYSDLYSKDIPQNLDQAGREKGIQKLMRVNLLKRLESSVDSFRITLGKFVTTVENTLKAIDDFEKSGTSGMTEFTSISNVNTDTESDDWLDEEFSIGDKVKLNLADMNTSGWKDDLMSDLRVAKDILTEMERVTPEHDQKLNDLKEFIRNKQSNPINKGNKKVLIFTAFADTANYLYRNLASYNRETLDLETAKITGTGTNDCTIDIEKQFNNLLIHFSPISKGRHERYANHKEIDVLIATDCISEGQNLQDCDLLINYDIHWNPVRIIQRFGRVDRIGSKNENIQLVNFWPQLSLDDYINLKNRVENRMLIVDATATGDDNVLTNEESDLMFRKKQLEKLQEEVVDIEDMDSSISITDLGLNDFRMDLVNYIKEHGSLDGVPNGMHAVCKKDAAKGIEEGAIFVLKNINQGVNIDNTNQLHPFYLVYVKQSGEILSTHLNVKQTLDMIRAISKGNNEPIAEAYTIFNQETDDGNDMGTYSALLNTAIESILNVKDEGDIDSLFKAGGTTALKNTIKGLEDFELLTFFAVK